MRNNNGLFFLRVGGTLLLIAAIVAGMLAAVNALTKDRIEQNELAEINTAIGELFGGEVERTDLQGEFPAGVRNVWQVSLDGEHAGYCIYTETQGYGGTIGMMVAFDTQGAVQGISIVEILETAGLGSRVNDGAYLSQYTGMTEEKSMAEVDAITGSTVSSRAVTEGVNLAVRTYQMIGGETNE